MILLFQPNETNFTNNGVGTLTEAVEAFVTEERNGAFELVLRYPVSGKHYAAIQYRSIIFCKPNPFDDFQPFRVYKISRPSNGIVTVEAYHISYDLTGIPLRPFHTYTIEGTFSALRTNAAINHNFTFSTDKEPEMQGEVQIDVPLSIRNVLGGMEGSVLQTYRGEFKFDKFNVALLTNRGQNRGIVLRYAKNILTIQQNEDFSTLYTGIAPYWKGEDVTVTLPETVVFIEGSFDFERILTLDLSESFDAPPTTEQLRNAAQAYAIENGLALPASSISVTYAMDKTISQVRLCDTIGIAYLPLGIQASAKCVKYVYDVLAKRYKEITIGSIRTNIADNYAKTTQNLTRRIRNIEADYATNGEIREIAQEEIRNDTSIIQRAEAIIATALEEYVRTSDYETFRSTVATQFSVLAGEIEAGFTSTASSISTLSGSTDQRFANIYSFIRLLATETDGQTVTQEGGVVIGESTSDIKLKLENDVLYFFMGDEKIVTNPIAWFASNQLYVNTASIQNLTLGTQGEYLDAHIVGSGDNICVLWSGRLA